MPTFTTISLENLFEPTVRVSLKSPVEPEPDRNSENPEPEPDSRHLYISPALYATPDQAPIPEENSSPYSSSPSPYLVNHKRRRGGGNEVEIGSDVRDLPLGGEECEFRMEEEVVAEDNFVNLEEFVGEGEEEEEESEAESRQVDCRSFVSAQGEFFDANDDFSSDGSMSNAPSCGSRIGSELHATRLSLLEEIEKRKIVEENLFLMRCQWERISKLMSQAGFTFPEPPTDSDGKQLDNNLMDLSQEVVVTRFVSEAIGRGEARAQAEEAAAAIIEAKDQEILRLRDKLQYFETVNHEMCQRKLVEVARRQQERKKRQQRWIWSFMGLSIAMGVSLAAYQYLPQASKFPSFLKSGDSTDTSNIAPSETSWRHTQE